MKIKMTPQEAAVIKNVLSRAAFEGSWYRMSESAVCVRVIEQIAQKATRV